MAIIFSDNFESGNLNAWTYKNAKCAAQTSVIKEGSYALQSDPVAGSAWVRKDFASAVGSIIIRAWVQASGTNECWPILSQCGQDNKVLDALGMVSGHFQYYDTGYHNLPVDATYSAGVWYQVVVAFDIINSIYRWWIDGAYKGSAALKDEGNRTLSGTDTLTKLYACQGAAATTILYMDTIIVEDYITEPMLRGYDRGLDCGMERGMC